jgi:hypothetical protein
MDQRELSEFEHHRLEHPDVSWVDPDDDLADERARNDWHGLNKTAQLPSDTKMGRCRARDARARLDELEAHPERLNWAAAPIPTRQRFFFLVPRQPQSAPSRVRACARKNLVGSRPRARSAHTRRARAPSSSDDGPSEPPSNPPALAPAHTHDLEPQSTCGVSACSQEDIMEFTGEILVTFDIDEELFLDDYPDDEERADAVRAEAQETIRAISDSVEALTDINARADYGEAVES